MKKSSLLTMLLVCAVLLQHCKKSADETAITPPTITATTAINYIGDSNLEGYAFTGVGEKNWATIVTRALQKAKGDSSALGITHFADPSRYGLTYGGTTACVAAGPVNRALQMSPGSTITFTAATQFVELYVNTDPSSGNLEFRRNGVLYRSISTSGTHAENVSTANTPASTPANTQASYEIKCTGANVVVTALFTRLFTQASVGKYNDYAYMGVSGQSFNDFAYPNIVATRGRYANANVLNLLTLGINSIYSRSKAISSAQYKTDLVAAITALRTSVDGSFKSDLIYVIPPRTIENTYGAVLEPYSNYYTMILQVMRDYNVTYIDLNNVINQSTPTYFGSDGLHYSDAGHAAIGAYVASVLAK